MMRRRPVARMAVRTTAVVGTAAVVGGHMANKQAQAAQAQQAAPEAAPAPAPEPAAAAPDPIAQLTQLAALKDSGALTEAEFEAEKAKILG
jgi:membrane protease subunit (stomatin/prohibitin family)